MKTIYTNILKGFFFILILFLAACTSRVNAENFNKIQNGMSFSQVTQILGKPSEVSSMTIGGLSGTSATWQGKEVVIVIQFVNDQVKIKTLNQNPTSDTKESEVNTD